MGGCKEINKLQNVIVEQRLAPVFCLLEATIQKSITKVSEDSSVEDPDVQDALRQKISKISGFLRQKLPAPDNEELRLVVLTLMSFK